MIIDSTENKEKILAEFLKIAAFDGWNKDSLLKAMANSGIEEKFASIVFPNFELDVAEFYIDSQNQKTIDNLNKIANFSQNKIRDKIRLSLYQRFEVEKDNKLVLQRLINFYLNPKNLTNFDVGVRPIYAAMKECYKISDLMWKNINDSSTDFNFYTKRLTLSKIILRSLFVFVKDESQDFSKTKDFIDCQIEKVMQFEKCKAKFKNFSLNAKDKFSDVFFDDNGLLKSPKKLIKNLPFFRLF